MLSFFWTAFIFSNSLKNGDQSKQASGKVVEIVQTFANAFGIEIQEEGEGLTIDSVSLFIRKGAHMTEFAILGILSFFSLSQFIKGPKTLYSLFYPLIVAISDELLQLGTPGRSGQVTDVLIDMAGATIAVFVVFFIVKLHKNKTDKSDSAVKSEKVYCLKK